MKAILAAFLLCFATSASASAIYHFQYQGNDLAILGNNPGKPQSLPGFQFDVYINTDFTGGKLTDFSYTWGDYEPNRGWVSVVGNNEIGRVWALDRRFQMYHRKASFSFDANGNITDWTLQTWEGPREEGGLSSTALDRVAFRDNFVDTWASTSPGTWRLVEVSEVPLPASALLLIGALGGLGAIRRIRSR